MHERIKGECIFLSIIIHFVSHKILLKVMRDHTARSKGEAYM